MKRVLAAACLATVVALSACGDKNAETEPAADADSPSEAAASSDETPTAGPAAAEADVAATPASLAPSPLPGAPDFAVLYPGGEIQSDGNASNGGAGSAGPGGIVTFTTASAPDEVIAFYRARAEAAGLSSVMAMSQGQTQAYGAHSAQTGANLSVVASTLEGQTNVQLSWSAGV